MTFVKLFFPTAGGPPPAPEWHEVQWLQPSDVANGDAVGGLSEILNGATIAMDRAGAICVVGVKAHNSANGAAYVFTRSGSTWSQAQKLTASDSVAGRNFGSSVAISGDGSTIIVGAQGNSATKGKAYVFTYSGSWSEVQILTDASIQTAGLYGASVAANEDGTVLAVGAPNDFSTGTVCAYAWNGSAWAQRGSDIFISSGANAAMAFGSCLALDEVGNTLAIGSPGKSESSIGNVGVVYVYTWGGSSWSQQQKVVYPTAAADRLGSSVSLSDDGNTMVAGNCRLSNFGAASFTRSGSTWSFEADLLTSGWYSAVCVTGDGNTAFIGRHNNAITDGVCDMLERSAGAWSTLVPSGLGGSSHEADDLAFMSVCIAKDGIYAAAVAPGDDEGGTDRGLIYFFEYS